MSGYQLYVWAFGDSPLDLDILRKADQAIAVVCDAQSRYKSMDVALTSAIDNDSIRVCQVLLPSSVPPRMDTAKLPQIQHTDHELFNSVLSHLNLVHTPTEVQPNCL